jgi:hypothetical protein
VRTHSRSCPSHGESHSIRPWLNQAKVTVPDDAAQPFVNFQLDLLTIGCAQCRDVGLHRAASIRCCSPSTSATCIRRGAFERAHQIISNHRRTDPRPRQQTVGTTKNQSLIPSPRRNVSRRGPPIMMPKRDFAISVCWRSPLQMGQKACPWEQPMLDQ